MNARCSVLLLAAGLLLGGLAGCAAPSAETGRNKSPAVVMALDPKMQKATALVHIGDELTFVLPASRGPEYVWQIISNDPRCLRQAGAMIFKPGAAGAPGTSSVSFIAQRPSRSFIRFGYVPATGAKETELADAYEILVTVRS